MQTAKAHTAILLFLRCEEEEARIKPLIRQKRDGRIYQALNRRVIRLARRSGLPVLVFKGSRQKGDSFGARFANAFREAFERGYDNVIALGNDCPQLQLHHLRTAQRALSEKAMVLGPDCRGGAYLIGLQQRAFHATDWERLPWQSDSLISALSAYAPSTLLPRERDLNNRQDLHRVLDGLRDLGLKHALAQLLQRPLPIPVFVRFGLPELRYLNRLSFRGPPISQLSAA